MSSVELLLKVLTFPLRKLNFGRSKILHKIMHNEILFRKSLKRIINVSALCLVFSDFFFQLKNFKMKFEVKYFGIHFVS